MSRSSSRKRGSRIDFLTVFADAAAGVVVLVLVVGEVVGYCDEWRGRMVEGEWVAWWRDADLVVGWEGRSGALVGGRRAVVSCVVGGWEWCDCAVGTVIAATAAAAVAAGSLERVLVGRGRRDIVLWMVGGGGVVGREHVGSSLSENLSLLSLLQVLEAEKTDVGKHLSSLLFLWVGKEKFSGEKRSTF